MNNGFQIIIGNQFLFERLAIVMYEDPSTYLLDDEGEKVQFLCSIGELKGKIQKDYDLSTDQSNACCSYQVKGM